MTPRLHSVALALAGLNLSHAAAESTLTVCASGCQYTSINDAIVAASDGDVIVLVAEAYLEGELIDLGGKQITLRGSLDKSGGPATVLDGAVDGQDLGAVLANWGLPCEH